MRSLIILLLLVACAPVKPVHLDMDHYRADCRYSRYQVAQLDQAIQAYESSGDTDQTYFQQLKNNIWSLRSGCQNLRDS